MKGNRWVDAIAVVVTFLLVTTTELSQARNICPNNVAPCVCSVKSKGLVIMCEKTNMEAIHKSMQTLKEFQGTVISYLTLRFTDTPHLPNYLFMGLDIRHLIVSNTNLGILEPSSLTALASKLEILDLSQNRLLNIPTPAVSRLHFTRYLNLNHNNITFVPEEAFKGMNEMERLSLYQNLITNIHPNAFKGVEKALVHLNFGSNRLTSVPIKAISRLPNLSILELQENRIESIKESDFSGLSNLDTLKLAHNMISELGVFVFKQLPRLSSLDLEFNHITKIDNRAFGGLEEKLEWLKLGNNSIHKIPSEALKGMHRLREFDVKGNNITEIRDDDFEGFGSTIKFLYMQNNQIESLPMPVFSNMHSLETINLGNNQIKHLSQNVFHQIIERIQFLDIHGNPLNCDCELLWYQQWLTSAALTNGDKVLPLALKTKCWSKLDNHEYEIRKAPLEKMYCPTTINSASVTATMGSGGILLLMGSLLKSMLSFIDHVTDFGLFTFAL